MMNSDISRVPAGDEAPFSKRHYLLDLKTGRRRPAMNRLPTLSSSEAPWQGLLLEQHTSGPVESVQVSIPHHTLFVQLTPAILEMKVGDGPMRTVQKQVGHVEFIPAMTPVSIRAANSGEFLAGVLQPAFFSSAVHEMVDLDRVALCARSSMEDGLLRAGLLALRAEVKSGSPGGRAYGDSLASAIAVQLVRHYASPSVRLAPSHGGLPRAHLRQILEFIQAHYAEDISLESMASVVGLSPFYFSRLFKQTMGLAPHQYLLKHRVERARELLRSPAQSTAEIAFQVGFCDQSHLTAHFKRIYGMTPSQYRRQMGVRHRPATFCSR